MSMEKNVKGSCLCGKIELTAEEMNTELGACHCSMCRKWSAGPFFAVDCGSNVKIESKDFLGVYNSSDWGERTFCKNCGTNLYYRLKEANAFHVSAELFDKTDLNFTHQIFIEEKPSYYNFSDKTKNMTGAEVFALYAPKE